MSQGYYKISIFDIMSEENTTFEELNLQELELYICDGFKKYVPYKNDRFFNILLNKFFGGCSYLAFNTSKQDLLSNFIKLYSTFSYHYFSNIFSIFSYKESIYYHIFICYSTDLIVELPISTDIFNDYHSLPACAISWYDFKGTFSNDFLVLKENESITLDVKLYGTPREEYTYNFEENRNDRRNYYFFNLLQVHKYGRKRKGLEDIPFDSFSSYEFKLQALINYFESKSKA